MGLFASDSSAPRYGGVDARPMQLYQTTPEGDVSGSTGGYNWGSLQGFNDFYQPAWGGAEAGPSQTPVSVVEAFLAQKGYRPMEEQMRGGKAAGKRYVLDSKGNVVGAPQDYGYTDTMSELMMPIVIAAGQYASGLGAGEAATAGSASSAGASAGGYSAAPWAGAPSSAATAVGAEAGYSAAPWAFSGASPGAGAAIGAAGAGAGYSAAPWSNSPSGAQQAVAAESNYSLAPWAGQTASPGAAEAVGAGAGAGAYSAASGGSSADKQALYGSEGYGPQASPAELSSGTSYWDSFSQSVPQFFSRAMSTPKGMWGLAQLGSSLYGMYEQRQNRKRFRMPNAADMPGMPGYQAGLEAVRRGMASRGYAGSTNMDAALLKYGGDFYNQFANQQMQRAQLESGFSNAGNLANLAGGFINAWGG